MFGSKIVIQQFSVSDYTWAAGTIGRYVSQLTRNVPTGYSLLGMFISDIKGGSNSAILMPFTSAGLGTTYVNIYAGTASAVSGYGFTLNMLLWKN